MTKMFSIRRYNPINYNGWIIGNEARKGVNIKRLCILKPEELEILNEAIPYQDQRDDPGQAEIVAYFALRLLDYLPGKREVAVPSALLHDIGWYRHEGGSGFWKKLVDRKDTEGEMRRRPAQNRACLIAGRILERLNYPEEYHNEIADIIGDHDTRKLPTTESGRILWDADFLWRVSYPCAMIYYKELTFKELLRRFEENPLGFKEPHNLSEIGMQIAKIEIANTLLFKYEVAKVN